MADANAGRCGGNGAICPGLTVLKSLTPGLAAAPARSRCIGRRGHCAGVAPAPGHAVLLGARRQQPAVLHLVHRREHQRSRRASWPLHIASIC